MIFIFSFYIEVIKVVKKILNNIFSGVFVGMVVFWDEILCIRSMYNIIVVLRFCRLKVKLYWWNGIGKGIFIIKFLVDCMFIREIWLVFVLV